MNVRVPNTSAWLKELRRMEAVKKQMKLNEVFELPGIRDLFTTLLNMIPKSNLMSSVLLN